MNNVEKFASAIEAARRSAPPSRPVLKDDTMRARVIAAAGRLQAYRDGLAQMRSFKAAGAPGAPNGVQGVDRMALGAGRAALADADDLCRSAIAAKQRGQVPGEDDPRVAAVVCGLQSAGPQRLQEVWAHIETHATDLLTRAGFTSRMIAGVKEIIAAVDIEVAAQGSKLVMTGTLRGQAFQTELETGPRPAKPRTVTDLLTRGQYDTMADGVARGEPMYLFGMPATASSYRLDDCWHLALVGTQRDVVRHVRGLEDVGLTIHQGGDPATIAVIIAVLYLALGFAINWARDKYCDPDVEHDTTEDVLCGVSTLLLFVWLVIAAAGAKTITVTDPNGNTTTYVQRWVFKPLLTDAAGTTGTVTAAG